MSNSIYVTHLFYKLTHTSHLHNKYIKIWVYTGNIFENVKDDWYELLYNYVDVLVDGPYVDSKRDLRLKFRGSSNQRVIDVRKSIFEGKVVEISD